MIGISKPPQWCHLVWNMWAMVQLLLLKWAISPSDASLTNSVDIVECVVRFFFNLIISCSLKVIEQEKAIKWLRF